MRQEEGEKRHACEHEKRNDAAHYHEEMPAFQSLQLIGLARPEGKSKRLAGN
jgi:hypothetical protein